MADDVLRHAAFVEASDDKLVLGAPWNLQPAKGRKHVRSRRLKHVCRTLEEADVERTAKVLRNNGAGAIVAQITGDLRSSYKLAVGTLAFVEDNS